MVSKEFAKTTLSSSRNYGGNIKKDKMLEKFRLLPVEQVLYFIGNVVIILWSFATKAAAFKE